MLTLPVHHQDVGDVQEDHHKMMDGLGRVYLPGEEGGHSTVARPPTFTAEASIVSVVCSGRLGGIGVPPSTPHVVHTCNTKFASHIWWL